MLLCTELRASICRRMTSGSGRVYWNACDVAVGLCMHPSITARWTHVGASASSTASFSNAQLLIPDTGETLHTRTSYPGHPSLSQALHLALLLVALGVRTVRQLKMPSCIELSVLVRMPCSTQVPSSSSIYGDTNDRLPGRTLD